MKFRLVVDDTTVEVDADERSVRMNGRVVGARVSRGSRGYVVRIGRRRYDIRPRESGLVVNGVHRRVTVLDVQEQVGPGAGRSSREALYEVHPPMPGRVISILVEPGATVARGQPILVLEAMKMQNEIPAPITGVVESLRVRHGDSVTPHDVLAILRGR